MHAPHIVHVHMHLYCACVCACDPPFSKRDGVPLTRGQTGTSLFPVEKGVPRVVAALSAPPPRQCHVPAGEALNAWTCLGSSPLFGGTAAGEGRLVALVGCLRRGPCGCRQRGTKMLLSRSISRADPLGCGCRCADSSIPPVKPHCPEEHRQLQGEG